MKSHIFMVMLLLCAGTAWATDVQYPASVELDGKTLTLRGWGYRTATWLKIKIYHAGLYTSESEGDPLKSDLPRLIDLTLDHNIDADELRKGWKDSILKNCGVPCAVAPEVINRFAEELTNATKGQSYRYIFYADRVEENGPVSHHTYMDPKFAEVLLATWIGEFPPTERLKKALLGLK